MKRGAQVGLAGLCNTGLELEDMTGRTVQESGCPQGSRSSVSAAAWWVSYYRGRWRQERRKLTGFQVEVKYCGLAEDDEDDKEQRDKTDNINKNQQLNKKLLDHFRHLAASNQDTDQVDLQLLDRAISDGADPNASDRYGQTVLHEVTLEVTSALLAVCSHTWRTVTESFWRACAVSVWYRCVSAEN